jgi:RNA-directed DNA polymerase
VPGLLIPMGCYKPRGEVHVRHVEESEMPIVVKKRGNSRGARGHYFKTCFRRKEYFKLSEPLPMKPKSQMSDEERIRDFQRKLYLKAKQEVKFRFYSLYDKIYLPYVLREAYARCRRNKGAPGIDGKTFDDIEMKGVGDFLKGIEQELKEQTYKPSMVKRTYIPKANGKMRPLGIPTIKDRVVQMACKMVIEPIFEADFEDTSYGFRPKKSAQDAIEKIKKNLAEGLEDIFDADLSAYFDTIPHKELLTLVGMRISDWKVLHLIKMWLKAPVWEDGKTSGGKKNKVGTPQGGVISPLLANIYLHLLDKAVKRIGGFFQKYGVRIVRYADDFVLMARKMAKESLDYLEKMLSKMKLKLNMEKSRTLKAGSEAFNFLGFTFRYDWDRHGRDSKYLNIMPSKKSEIKVRENIDKYLKENGHRPPETVAMELNAITRGWINYFHIPGTSYPQKAKRNLRFYLMKKLYRYYRRKSQRKCKLYKRGAFEILQKKFGLIDPAKYLIPKPLYL